MAKKKARADGLVEKTVTINGKRKHFYGRSEAEVLRKIADYSDEQEHGVKFSEVVDGWEKEHYKTLEYNTLKGYKPAARRAKERFGEIPVREITTNDVSAFIKDFSRNKARKTVTTQLLVIRLIFEYAQAHHGLQYNPAIPVKVPKGLPKSERPYPTQKEREDVMAKTDAAHSLFMRIALRCGLRRAEICALRGMNFDKEHHVFVITHSMYWENNKPKLKVPKSQKGLRVVPIPDDLYEDICAIGAAEDEPLFKGKDGGFLLNYEVHKIVKEFKETSGIQLTPHSFRHGYASALHNGGVDVLTARDLLGHAQATTTLNIYTHIETIEKERSKELRDKITNLK